jgi:hypothetical protein
MLSWMVVLVPPARVDRWQSMPAVDPATLNPELFPSAVVMPAVLALLAVYLLSAELRMAQELQLPSAAVIPFREMAVTSSSRAVPVQEAPVDLS